MDVPANDLNALLASLRTTLDTFSQLMTQCEEPPAQSMVQGNAESPCKSDNWQKLEERQAAAFREYGDCFEALWKAAAPLLSAYPKWNWKYWDCHLECSWGNGLRTSMCIFRVGVSVAVEVRTPISMNSYLDFLPQLIAGIEHIHVVEFDGKSTTIKSADSSDITPLQNRPKALAHHLARFVAATCQAILLT